MRIFGWRTKLSRVLEKLESLTEQVEEFSELLSELEDKENKVIAALETENNNLRERLHQKDIYVENLLAQLLGGASIKNILSDSQPKKEETPLSPAMKKYMEKKKNNGGVPLP